MGTRDSSAQVGGSGRGPLGLAATVAIAVLIVLCGPAGPPGDTVHAQATGTFKIAFWNIGSGFGKSGLPGRTCSFVPTGNCTDPSLPLNAWGIHVVQDELIRRIRNDGAVVALGLAEAWSCATPAAVQQVLGWSARSTVRSGIALVARFGFAGPEEWIQLDTTTTLNPADTKFVLRVPVCLDQGCTRSIVVYSTHLYAYSATEALEYDNYTRQAAQVLDFTAARSGTAPHVVIGDFNIFEGTSIVCTQKPKNAGIQMFRAAGYLDAWSAVHATDDGSTGIWNRTACGVPEGNLWKRIDFGWTKRVNPLTVTRFGMVEPGQCAPSDHAGILMEYALEDPAVAPPTVTVTAPSQNATVAGLVWLSAGVTGGGGVSRVEWLLDGRVIGVQSSSPFLFEWDAAEVANGAHVLQAAATNLAGRRAVSAARAVTVANPIGSNDEIVLYADDATVAGTRWSFVADPTAAAGTRLQNTNAAATVTSPAAQPSSYAELSFIANAGTPYRLWIRGKAIGNDPANDAVFVQFNDSVDAAGSAAFRIGSGSATTVNIEDCIGCSLSGWGWQDNESGRDVLGRLVYFPTTGTHRLRMQAREDGLGIDQIVLSAVRYRFGAPGAPLNDTTILPPPGGPGNVPPAVQLTAPAAGTTVTAPASVALAATASDPDDAVAYVEFYANSTLIARDISAPYAATWTASTAGTYTLTARAADTRGATTTSSGRSVTVLPPPSGGIDEVVVHVAAPGAAQILGGWAVVADTSAAAGARLQNPNAAAPKVTTPLATPTQAFEVTFNAEAGKGYRIWLRGKALDNQYVNDSVFLQFDRSVTATGAATWRIGTTSATPVIIEDASGAGLQGWGWGDNIYTANALGPLVYFAQNGTQRLRIQMREDGVGLDQFVLSAVRFYTARPGATRNDTTILPEWNAR